MSVATTPPMSLAAITHESWPRTVVHQRVEIARVGHDVVLIVGRNVAVADAPKIRGDDLESRRR